MKIIWPIIAPIKPIINAHLSIQPISLASCFATLVSFLTAKSAAPPPSAFRGHKKAQRCAGQVWRCRGHGGRLLVVDIRIGFGYGIVLFAIGYGIALLHIGLMSKTVEQWQQAEGGQLQAHAQQKAWLCFLRLWRVFGGWGMGSPGRGS